MKTLNELSAPTPSGRARRKFLNEAIEGTAHEFHGIGVEMNHRYVSDGIILDDEQDSPPEWPEDKVLHHKTSTYPGSRLPHAWLNSRIPVPDHTSTHDIAGHGVFTLFTGIGGDGWKTAADRISKELGIVIKAVSIGWKQDWEDVYRDWERKREVQEDGCVLVRPDRYVCWRSMEGEEEERRLRRVMGRVLGR